MWRRDLPAILECNDVHLMPGVFDLTGGEHERLALCVQPRVYFIQQQLPAMPSWNVQGGGRKLQMFVLSLRKVLQFDAEDNRSRMYFLPGGE